MSTINYTTESIQAAVPAAARPFCARTAAVRAAVARAAGRAVPAHAGSGSVGFGSGGFGSGASVVEAGKGLVKQAHGHLAMTRTDIDGWPPGPQDRTSG